MWGSENLGRVLGIAKGFMISPEWSCNARGLFGSYFSSFGVAPIRKGGGVRPGRPCRPARRHYQSDLGLSSIGLSTARQVSIAGMTQPISAQAIGPPGPTHLEVVMRMLLKAVLDTEAANEVFRSGAAAEALDRIQEALQPEVLYGFIEDGERAFFAVFDLADPSEIPVISEPLFQRANVKLTLTPCMTLEDVKKGIEEAARRMAAMQG
jgi:hypothetical protein